MNAAARVAVTREGTRKGFPLDLVCPFGRVGLTVTEARDLIDELTQHVEQLDRAAAAGVKS